MIRKKTALPAPKAESFRCVGNTQKKKTAGLSLRPGTGVKTAPAAPCRSLCCRAKDPEQPKQLCLQKTFWEKRAETTQRITSQRGIHLRLCRSIQVEGAFALLKNDFGFRRFLTRGRANIRAELFLLAMAFDLKKLWMKREHGRLQTRVSEKMTA